MATWHRVTDDVPTDRPILVFVPYVGDCAGGYDMVVVTVDPGNSRRGFDGAGIRFNAVGYGYNIEASHWMELPGAPADWQGGCRYCGKKPCECQRNHMGGINRPSPRVRRP